MSQPAALLEAYFDNTLDAAQLSALADWLRADAAHADAFAERSLMERHLTERHIAGPAQTFAHVEPADRRLSPHRFALALAVAAVCVMALTAGMWATFRNAHQKTSPPAVTPALGLLSDVSDDALFAAGASRSLGSELSAGDVQLERGTAQLMFRSGAVVDLTGPCRFEMTGENAGILHAGLMQAFVSHRAHGFTVTTPAGARIIDLGTRFRVFVGPGGREELSVLEGRVRLERGSTMRELLAGQIARIDAHDVTFDTALPSSIIGLWRFEPDDGDATTVATNDAAPGRLDGLSDESVLLSSDVPGREIFDPLSGRTWSDRASMDLSTGPFKVPDDAAIEASDFTIEAFVKMGPVSRFPTIVTHLHTDDSGWSMDLSPERFMRVRFDAGPQPDLRNQYVGMTAAQTIADGKWHHVAVVLSGNVARIYVDYANMATRTLRGEVRKLTRTDAPMLLGASRLPGRLDEVRYTATALSPEQFLRVVPHEKSNQPIDQTRANVVREK